MNDLRSVSLSHFEWTYIDEALSRTAIHEEYLADEPQQKTISDRAQHRMKAAQFRALQRAIRA